MIKVLPEGATTDKEESGSLQRRGFIPAVVFLVSLALLGAGWIAKGDADAAIRPDTDDFILAGQAILNWIVTGGSGLEAMKSHAVFPHYSIPSIVLACVYMYFSEPVVKVVTLNAVLFSLLLVFLYQFWMMVYGRWSRWGGRQGFMVAGAGGFYIVFGLPDPFLLSYTVLTDIIFLFWMSLFVVITCRGILEGGRASWMVALLLALVAPYVRPQGVLLPILLLYALVVNTISKRGIGMGKLAVGSIGILVAITLVMVPWLVSMKINGADWVDTVVPNFIQREFDQAVHYFRNGVVVSNRLETYVDTPGTYFDVVRMMLHRLVYYLIPLRLGEAPYSLAHNLVNLVYILIAWPLMFIGVKRMFAENIRCRVAALFLIMVVLSYALFHSATLLSFSWRYQLPAMVPLWMLAGVGLFSVLGYPVRVRDFASKTP